MLACIESTLHSFVLQQNTYNALLYVTASLLTSDFFVKRLVVKINEVQVGLKLALLVNRQNLQVKEVQVVWDAGEWAICRNKRRSHSKTELNAMQCKQVKASFQNQKKCEQKLAKHRQICKLSTTPRVLEVMESDGTS